VHLVPRQRQAVASLCAWPDFSDRLFHFYFAGRFIEDLASRPALIRARAVGLQHSGDGGIMSASAFAVLLLINPNRLPVAA